MKTIKTLFEEHQCYSEEIAKLSIRVKEKFDANYEDLIKFTEGGSIYCEEDKTRHQFFRVNRAFSDTLKDSLHVLTVDSFIDREAILDSKAIDYIYSETKRKMAYMIAEEIISSNMFMAEETSDWRGIHTKLSVVLFNTNNKQLEGEKC